MSLSLEDCTCKGPFTLRAVELRSAASNSKIETGAIRAAKSARRCCSHYARRTGAARRYTAPHCRAASCGADGAQTGAALLRRTARSVNAP